jgi:hypothetical protein
MNSAAKTTTPVSYNVVVFEFAYNCDQITRGVAATAKGRGALSHAIQEAKSEARRETVTIVEVIQVGGKRSGRLAFKHYNEMPTYRPVCMATLRTRAAASIQAELHAMRPGFYA